MSSCVFLLCLLHMIGIDPDRTTMKEVYEKFGLDGNTADFTGHAFALHPNDR